MTQRTADFGWTTQTRFPGAERESRVLPSIRASNLRPGSRGERCDEPIPFGESPAVPFPCHTSSRKRCRGLGSAPRPADAVPRPASVHRSAFLRRQSSPPPFPAPPVRWRQEASKCRVGSASRLTASLGRLCRAGALIVAGGGGSTPSGYLRRLRGGPSWSLGRGIERQLELFSHDEQSLDRPRRGAHAKRPVRRRSGHGPAGPPPPVARHGASGERGWRRGSRVPGAGRPVAAHEDGSGR